MTKTKRTILTILSLVGLALAIELCFVYYNANFVTDAAPSICAINDSMDCDGVAKTAYSQLFGVPLSLWGVLLYLFFLFMTFVDKIQNVKGLGIFKVFKNNTSYLFTIGLFSFCCSIVLGCVSVFKIGSVCIFCFMTYLVNLLIAISAKSKEKTILEEIKTTINDFIDALKIKKYLVLFIVLCAIMTGVLSYTTITAVLAPQIQLQREFNTFFGEYKDYTDGNKIGPKDADVIVHEYMDFNCGGCYMAHIYIHRILDEFENVAFVQHNLPLDITCNHNMQYEGHKNSCLKSYYALAAAKQNKYWIMGNILFEDDIRNEQDIISRARLIDIDLKKLKEDANSEEIKNEVLDSIKDADSKNIQATPTLYIGVRQFNGITSYPDFKQIIIENGGKEKPNHG